LSCLNCRIELTARSADHCADGIVRAEVFRAIHVEKSAELRTRAVDAALDGADGAAADRGRVLIGEARCADENKRFALILRKLLKRRAKLFKFQMGVLCRLGLQSLGIAAVRILDFPSLNSRQFETLQREQKARFPELATLNDAYFARKFEARQARRDGEMALADVIITNSSLTRRSHIDGGADPGKTFAVPYGAPANLAAEADLQSRPNLPLQAIWAGTFSVRKGAHLMLDAWRRLDPGKAARLDVYGAMGLPPSLLENAPNGTRFRGSVPQAELLAAFDTSDVLVFPTLSDGFGMVVTEAFSRGLPVITTDQAGAADLVEHGRNGLIIPAGDVDALADALRWCLDNRNRLAEMRHAALDTARKWQWSDYRQALREAVATGLARASQRRRG